MKAKLRITLLMGLFTAGALSSPGCGGGTSAPGNFTVGWTITLDNVASTCTAVGAAKFSIIATRVGASVGDDFRYNCTAYIATTDNLPAGTYNITVRLLDAANNEIIGFDLTSTHTLFGNDILDLGDFNFPFGRFDAGWDGCVSGERVSITAHNVTTAIDDIFVYNCIPMSATSDALPGGTYTFTADLRDSGGGLLSHQVLSGTTTLGGNGPVFLPTIHF
jgi:hypothetical protein